MNSHRNLTIATLISSMCILSGAGHGVIPMVIAEVFVLIRPKELLFKISHAESESSFIFIAAAIVLLGQLILFFTTVKRKLVGRIIALALLLTGFFFLIQDVFTGDSLASFSFTTGIPFLGISGTLLILDIKQYLQIRNQPQEL